VHRLRAAADFALLESKPHHSFGHHLIGEIWEREL
jgi:hypothetical protein